MLPSSQFQPSQETQQDSKGQVRGYNITERPRSLKVEIVPKHTSQQSLARTSQHPSDTSKSSFQTQRAAGGGTPAPQGVPPHANQQQL